MQKLESLKSSRFQEFKEHEFIGLLKVVGGTISTTYDNKDGKAVDQITDETSKHTLSNGKGYDNICISEFGNSLLFV